MQERREEQEWTGAGWGDRLAHSLIRSLRIPVKLISPVVSVQMQKRQVRRKPGGGGPEKWILIIVLLFLFSCCHRMLAFSAKLRWGSHYQEAGGCSRKQKVVGMRVVTLGP